MPNKVFVSGVHNSFRKCVSILCDEAIFNYNAHIAKCFEIDFWALIFLTTDPHWPGPAGWPLNDDHNHYWRKYVKESLIVQPKFYNCDQMVIRTIVLLL